MTTPPVLEAVDVTKHFDLPGGDRVRAVENANVTLHPGRIVALVGESGSGKTTVARLLARMYATTSGQIRLHGEPVDAGTQPDRAYYRQVQLVFQDPFGSLSGPYHRLHPATAAAHPRPRAHQGTGPPTRHRTPRTGRPHPRRELPVATPARAVRRPAPARGDRPCPRGTSLGAARRRADLDAGRVHPAGHAEPAGAAARRGGPGPALHHPRHRLRPLPLRRRSGRCTRDRWSREARRTPSSTHPATPTPGCSSKPPPIRPGVPPPTSGPASTRTCRTGSRPTRQTRRPDAVSIRGAASPWTSAVRPSRRAPIWATATGRTAGCTTQDAVRNSRCRSLAGKPGPRRPQRPETPPEHRALPTTATAPESLVRGPRQVARRLTAVANPPEIAGQPEEGSAPAPRERRAPSGEGRPSRPPHPDGRGPPLLARAETDRGRR